MFGLDTDTVRNIKQAFAKIPDIDKVVLYGSRAKGNYRNGSDIDITLFGKKLTLDNSVYPLMDELEELYLPYMFDISIFADIDNEDLVEHINRDGKVFYQRGVENGKLKIENGKCEERGLPKGWEVKKLGDVCDVLDKFRKPITKRNRIEGEYPYYGATGVLSYVHEYIFDEKLVLIGEDGAKWKSGDNSSFIVSGKYWVNNHAHVIRPIRDIILDEWIVDFLNFSDLTRYITGMTVPKLNQEKMKSIKILIPPLPEQKRIVAVLDQAFTTIASAKANTEQNLKNARELFQSKLQTEFANGKLKIESGEWEEKKLGEVYDVRDGTHDSPTYINKGFALITSKNLKNDVLNYDKVKYISEQDYININKRSKVDIGDILFAMIGTIGNPIVIKDKPCFAIKNVALFKIPENHDSYFLKYYLDSKAVIQKMSKDAKGATQKFVGLGYLRSFKIRLPTLSEQKHITKKLNAISTETKKLETIYQQKIDDLNELKKSILQKAFNGELNKVKDYTKEQTI